MLPNFLVIGAQKAGTTSLYHYLRAHPDIAMPDKEPNFFADDREWSRGLAHYESIFAGADGAKALGEASTGYSMFPMFPNATQRIAQTLPHARLVYLLRDPVERVRSSYQHALAGGFEGRPIEEAALDDMYLAPSRYAAQLDRYRVHFPPEQILVILSDDLRSDPSRTLQRVYRHLDVDASWVGDQGNEEFHRTEGKRVPRSWARAVGGMAIRRGWDTAILRRLSAMRQRGSPLLTRPMRPSEAALTETLRQEIGSRLAGDTARLREWLGPDFHCWGLA